MKKAFARGRMEMEKAELSDIFPIENRRTIKAIREISRTKSTARIAWRTLFLFI